MSSLAAATVLVPGGPLRAGGWRVSRGRRGGSSTSGAGHALADLGLLGGPPGWATARAGWNEGGVGLRVRGPATRWGSSRPGPQHAGGAGRGAGLDRHAGHADGPPGDAVLPPVRGGADRGRAGRSIERHGRRSGRSRGRWPTPPLQVVAGRSARAERTAAGWLVEVFFPGSCPWPGSIPGENRRLGLAYQRERTRCGGNCSSRGWGGSSRWATTRRSGRRWCWKTRP